MNELSEKAKEAAEKILEMPVVNEYMLPYMAAYIQIAIDAATAKLRIDYELLSDDYKAIAESNAKLREAIRIEQSRQRI